MRPVARSVTSLGWAGTGLPTTPTGTSREEDPPSEPRIGDPCRGRTGSLGRLGHDVRCLDSSLIASLRGYRPRRERRRLLEQRRDYATNTRFHPDPDDRSRSSPSARLRPIPARQPSPNRSVSQIQIFRTEVPRSGRWRPHPIGQKRTVAIRADAPFDRRLPRQCRRFYSRIALRAVPLALEVHLSRSFRPVGLSLSDCPKNRDRRRTSQRATTPAGTASRPQ